MPLQRRANAKAKAKAKARAAQREAPLNMPAEVREFERRPIREKREINRASNHLLENMEEFPEISDQRTSIAMANRMYREISGVFDPENNYTRPRFAARLVQPFEMGVI